jgi:chemotaxis protein MotB
MFKTIFTTKASVALLALASLSACVPSRKFNELKTEKESMASKMREAQIEQRRLADLNKNFETTLAARDKTIAELQRDTSNIYPLYRRVKSANADLNALYEKALAQSNSLAASAAGEKRELAEMLTKKEIELNRKEMDLFKSQQELFSAQKAANDKEALANKAQAAADKAQAEAEANKTQAEASKAEGQKLKADAERLKAETERLQATSGKLQGDLTATQGSLAAREQRVKELEGVISAQQAKSDELRTKLNSALSNFNSSELSVTQRDGKVYVSLSQELLFASGSTEVNKKGKDALASLAGVLARNSDVQIAVEGHTDNVPFKGTGAMRDNWDLSVLRATSIVKLLTTGGVDARRVTASGHGEYVPVSDNSTTDGKAKNRRTEIILSPKLDDLYNLLKN